MMIKLKAYFKYCTSTLKNESRGEKVMRCVPRFVYSTKDGKQPSSVVKACKVNFDCGERGVCLTDGQCQCAAGRFGINCRQRLFAKRAEYTNDDGSERCLKFIEPRKLKTGNSSIAISVRSWSSQFLVTEVAVILLKEIM